MKDYKSECLKLPTCSSSQVLNYCLSLGLSSISVMFARFHGMNSIPLPEKCPGKLGSMATAYLKATFKI